ncbi:dTMP kinase [Dethiothermospora halolimnae]|uniref:dTMP kinase n=1 Tax=Dethiothermospora halolimnae TaxID=3114390 RepID=UPI003CCBA9B1
MEGIFITMEGPDGSGKSTITKLLTNYLKEKGYNIVITREPGGTELSEIIRNVVLDTKNTNMSPVTEALLYAASRAQHVEEKILPALKKGKIVISERFVDSSLVYQGIARNIGIDKVKNINDFATQNIEPDLTLFFDIKPEDAFKRMARRGKKDRLEMESIDFHNEVYDGYIELSKKYPQRIKIIDATKDIEEVFQQVKNKIDLLL